jgi:hypothetical protein
MLERWVNLNEREREREKRERRQEKRRGNGENEGFHFIDNPGYFGTLLDLEA